MRSIGRSAALLGGIFGLFSVVGIGCDKSSSGAGNAPSSTMTATTTPSATSGASASASASSSAASSASPAGSAAVGSSSYSGPFKSKVGQVVTPKDAHIKVWGDDPGTALLGDGTVTVHAAGVGDRRAVTGDVKGVFGNLVIAGELDGKTLQARVDPKDVNAADAMTGVLQGTLEGNVITATLRVANRNANIVREADVKLSVAP